MKGKAISFKPVSAVLMLASVLLWASLATSRPSNASRRLKLTAVYDVAPGCMSAGTFLHKLSEHMVRGGGNGLRSYVVALYNEDKRQYSAAMSFNGGESIVLQGPQCNPLLEEAVLEAGMARTLIPPSSREDKKVTITLLALAKGEQPKPLLSTGQTTVLPHKTETETRPAVVQSDFSPFEPVLDKLPNTKPLVFSSNIQTARGLMPQQALGFGIAASALWGQIQWEVDATLWQPQQWKPWNASRFPSSTLSAISVGTSACSSLSEQKVQDSIFRLNACARVGVNRLAAEASELFGATTVYNVGVGTRLATVWQIQSFTFEAFGRVDALTRGPALTVDRQFDTGTGSRDNSFRMASTVSTLGLQMGWNFDFRGGAKIQRN